MLLRKTMTYIVHLTIGFCFIKRFHLKHDESSFLFQLKGNRNQICWLVKKVKAENNHGFKTFQEFLDNQQYSRNGILRYEMIFGHNYISTGGKETTEVRENTHENL